jgi:O-antigen ligase
MNVGSYRDSILIGSFLTWCVLLTFPTLARESALQSDGNAALLYQALGAAQFIAAAILFRLPGTQIKYDYFQISVLIIVYLSFALQMHGDASPIANGIAYTIALIATIVSLSLISAMPADALERCFGGAAVVLVAFGVSAIALFGWPEGRQLGPIHPNAFGSVMLSAFIFAQFREGALFLLLRMASLILAASVSSRFALIGCLLALVVFEITRKPLSLRVLVFPVLSAACFVLFNQQIVAVLALDDPARNLGSGFTGRDEEWAAGFKAIAEYPFGMGFKRPPLEGGWGHNGYLRIFLEFGVIGGSLINIAVLSIILRALFEAIAGFREDSRLRRFASARAAGLAGLLFATFFQPQMFNLGDMHGISFMLLLFWHGRRSVRQPRLSLQDERFDYRPTRAPSSSTGDQR